MIGALYRLHQWRHTRGKVTKDATFRLAPAIEIIRARAQLPRLAQILDIGPRNLHEVELLEPLGNVVAVDLFPTDGRIRRGDLHNLPILSRAADLVFASHVLEHSRDLPQAAREIARVTRPDGYVWIAVPAGQVPDAHDRHRFDTILDVVGLFADARPELLFEEVRPGRDVRVLMRLHKNGPKRILYVLPDAFAVRNVEASGLLRRLTERGHHVTALCGTQGVELIKGVECGALAPYLGSRLRQWARRGPLRTLSYIGRAHRGETTYGTKLARRDSRRERLAIMLLRSLDRMVDGESVAWFVERCLPVFRSAMRVMARLQPDVLVVHTSVYEGVESELVKAAFRHRVPVVAQVASFDTLFCKGSFLIKPTRLAVWGEHSRLAAIDRHGFDPTDVCVTGPPHWDVYATH